MSLDEYKKVMEIVGSKVAPDAKIISGAQISPDMGNTLKVLLIVTGVKSSQIIGAGSEDIDSKKGNLQEELGISFFEEWIILKTPVICLFDDKQVKIICTSIA